MRSASRSSLHSPPAALAWEHAQALCGLLIRDGASRASLAERQARKLRALIAHCRRSVALYREHWRDVPLDAAQAALPGAIVALPTIGKDDFRRRPLEDALAAGADSRRLLRHSTSGSSGQPFTVCRSAREEHLLNLFRIRAQRRAGLRVSDRLARFSQLAQESKRGWPGRVREALGIHRSIVLDGLAPAGAMVEALLGFRPTVVCGYPSTLQQIATALSARDRQRVRPRLLFCGGELLTASARRAIEAAFGAPLVEFYGAHEFNLLASQCPAGHGYHVCDDSVLVEIVDERGRPVPVGTRGEVVATALHSYTMPFVRYRTGDLAIRGGDACACGARCSTLRAIEGRSADYLRLPGGRRMHPYAITAQLADREGAWVTQHQLVQMAATEVVLQLRTARPATLADVDRVRAAGAAILGPDVRFDVVVVEHIATGPSGKFRPYVTLPADTAASG